MNPNTSIGLLFALMACILAPIFAENNEQVNKKNLRGLQTGTCPEKAPVSQSPCGADQDGLQCDYNYIWMASYKNNKCSGPLSCSPTEFASCFGGQWMIATFGLLDCGNFNPSNLYQACEP